MSRNIRKRSADSVINQVAPQQVKSLIKSNCHIFNKRLTNVDLLQSKTFSTPDGFTMFRIWPSLNPENPSELIESGLFTYGGNKKKLRGLSLSNEILSTITGLRVNQDERKTYRKGIRLGPTNFIYAKDRASYLENVPYSETPFVLLTNQVYHGKKEDNTGSGIRWNKQWDFLNVYNEKEGYAPIPRKQASHFAIVSLYENCKAFNLERMLVNEYDQDLERYVETEIPRNGVPYGEAEGDPLVVLRLSESLFKDLMLLLEVGQKEAQKYKRRLEAAKKDKSIKPPERPETTFPYGDPVGVFDKVKNRVNGGLFFHQFNGKITEFDGISTQDSQGYCIGLSDEYEGPNATMTPSLNPAMVNRILQNNLFFEAEEGYEDADDYLLRVAGIEEQCELLAHAFYPVKEVLKYAWASHPEYLEYECVRSVMTNKVNYVTQANSSVDPDDYPEEATEDSKPLKSRTKFEVEDEVDTEALLDEVAQEEEVEPVAPKKKKVGKSMISAPKKAKKDELFADSNFDVLNEPAATMSDDFDDESDDFDDESDDFDDDDDDDDYEDDDDDFEDDDDDEMEAKLNKSLAKAKAVEQQPRKRFRS